MSKSKTRNRKKLGTNTAHAYTIAQKRANVAELKQAMLSGAVQLMDLSDLKACEGKVEAKTHKIVHLKAIGVWYLIAVLKPAVEPVLVQPTVPQMRVVGVPSEPVLHYTEDLSRGIPAVVSCSATKREIARLSANYERAPRIAPISRQLPVHQEIEMAASV